MTKTKTKKDGVIPPPQKGNFILPPQRVNGKLVKGLTKTELKKLKNKTK